MRIIAGSLKGRRLAGPEKDSNDIRPTADMAREALFSILLRWPRGSFLDLFAGTGAVAVEAFSRGYAPVTAVEQAGTAWGLLQRNAQGTSVNLVRKDVRQFAAVDPSRFAVIFADPPYAKAEEHWIQLAAILRPWMAPDGVLVWETDRKTPLTPQPGWEEVDVRRYGLAHLHFLEPRSSE